MVPPVLEPSSTGVGTKFHPYWNAVPPALERRYIRTVTALHPYCEAMRIWDKGDCAYSLGIK